MKPTYMQIYKRLSPKAQMLCVAYVVRSQAKLDTTGLIAKIWHFGYDQFPVVEDIGAFLFELGQEIIDITKGIP